MTNGFKIRGHSSFNIFLKRNDQCFVRKSTKRTEDNYRLKIQCKKQIDFLKNNTNDYLTTSRVLSSGIEETLYYFDMEYFSHLTFADFFLFANKRQIDFTLKILIDFIKTNIEGSVQKSVSHEIILKKYETVKKNIMLNKNVLNSIDFTILDKMFYGVEDLFLPIGYNHGDFTFSNMLFNKTGNKIVLLDFLDSFLETPLNDIIKLQQDTKFNWSFLLYTHTFQKIRLQTIMNYYNIHIEKTFNTFEFYRKYKKIFHILNLLRILPYVKTQNIFDTITSYIENVIQNKNA